MQRLLETTGLMFGHLEQMREEAMSSPERHLLRLARRLSRLQETLKRVADAVQKAKALAARHAIDTLTELNVKCLEANGQVFDVAFTNEYLPILGQIMADSLRSRGAKNYLEATISCRGEPFVLSIRRKHGEQAAEVAGAAMKLLEKLYRDSDPDPSSELREFLTKHGRLR